MWLARFDKALGGMPRQHSLSLMHKVDLLHNPVKNDLLYSERKIAMRYETIKNLSQARFRRLTGVKQETFDEMTRVLSEAKARQKAHGGKPNSLSIEDQLLMMLGY